MNSRAATFIDDPSMTLRPPSFGLLLALTGATLVLWGARNAVLRVPGIGDINLFEMDKAAAWSLCIASATTMLFFWLPPKWMSAAGFVIALGSVGFLCYDLVARVNDLRATGAPAAMIDGVIHFTAIKPGAVGVGSGLVILAVALGMKRE